VQATFRLNSNSIVLLEKVEAEITVTTVSLVPKYKNITSTKKEDVDKDIEDTDSPNEDDSEDTPTTDSSDTNEDATEDTSNEETTEDKKEETQVEMEEKVSTKVHRITLKATPIQVPGMLDKHFANSKKILADINARIEAKREKEREKNNVESYVYDTRDKLETEDILRVSTEEQREKFQLELSNAGDWLYEEGRDASASQYREKLAALKKEGDAFFKRVAEITLRPQAIEYANLTINTTRTFMQNITAVYEVTEEEKEDVLELLDELESWLNEKTSEQDKKAPHEPLAFTSDQVYKKCKTIESKVKPMFYKKVRKPKVEKPANTTETISPEDVKIEVETEQEEESINNDKEEL
jgi:hypoxia up-regulated 1